MLSVASRIGLAIAVMGLVVGIAGPARAGLVTSLTASPNEISAGGTTNLSLSITYTPQAAGYQSTAYSGAYEYTTYYTGGGGISSLSGSILPANGQSFSLAPPAPNSTSYTASETAQYASPGSYTASANGSVWTYDQVTVNVSEYVQTGSYYSGGYIYPIYNFVYIDSYQSEINFTNTSFSVQAPVQVDPVSAPEPSSLISGGIAGLIGLGFAWRRYRKAGATVPGIA